MPSLLDPSSGQKSPIVPSSGDPHASSDEFYADLERRREKLREGLRRREQDIREDNKRKLEEGLAQIAKEEALAKEKIREELAKVEVPQAAPSVPFSLDTSDLRARMLAEEHKKSEERKRELEKSFSLNTQKIDEIGKEFEERINALMKEGPIGSAVGGSASSTLRNAQVQAEASVESELRKISDDFNASTRKQLEDYEKKVADLKTPKAPTEDYLAKAQEMARSAREDPKIAAALAKFAEIEKKRGVVNASSVSAGSSGSIGIIQGDETKAASVSSETIASSSALKGEEISTARSSATSTVGAVGTEATAISVKKEPKMASVSSGAAGALTMTAGGELEVEVDVDRAVSSQKKEIESVRVALKGSGGQEEKTKEVRSPESGSEETTSSSSVTSISPSIAPSGESSLETSSQEQSFSPNPEVRAGLVAVASTKVQERLRGSSLGGEEEPSQEAKSPKSPEIIDPDSLEWFGGGPAPEGVSPELTDFDDLERVGENPPPGGVPPATQGKGPVTSPGNPISSAPKTSTSGASAQSSSAPSAGGGRGGQISNAIAQKFKNKKQQDAAGAEEDDAGFDFILLFILLAPAIFVDLFCLIPIIGEVVSPLAISTVRLIFWLKNIKPGRLIEAMIKRILEQQTQGGSINVPLPKETGKIIGVLFDVLFIGLTLSEVVPAVSEVLPGISLFILGTYLLCKVEERVIRKLKESLKQLGALGRIVAAIPIVPPQFRAIGGAVAAADDVVNKGTPAGEAVSQEMKGVAPGGAGGAMGVGGQVGAGGAQQAEQQWSGAQGTPLAEGSPTYGAGAGASAPRMGPGKTALRAAQQRMRIRDRKKEGKKSGQQGARGGSGVDNKSGRPKSVDGISSGDGGRFAAGSPAAKGSPIVGAGEGIQINSSSSSTKQVKQGK